MSSIANELYRSGATIGDGGSASALMYEFYAGESTHLTKATERLIQLKKLATTKSLGLNDLDVLEAFTTDLENAINMFK